MSEDEKKRLSELQHEELDIIEKLKLEPKKVNGKLNFEHYMELHAELRGVRAAMASLALS